MLGIVVVMMLLILLLMMMRRLLPVVVLVVVMSLDLRRMTMILVGWTMILDPIVAVVTQVIVSWKLRVVAATV